MEDKGGNKHLKTSRQKGMLNAFTINSLVFHYLYVQLKNGENKREIFFQNMWNLRMKWMCEGLNHEQVAASHFSFSLNEGRTHIRISLNTFYFQETFLYLDLYSREFSTLKRNQSAMGALC